MNSEKPLLVSVITPSFNQGHFIRETLLSVKSQDYAPIEHIVIDGGSTDNTLEILKKFEGIYNLRWISEPDEGHADAVNKGFRMAQGEIIGWLNSDDVYVDRDVVKVVVETFQQHRDADIVYGDALFIGEDGKILRVQCCPGFSYRRLLQWCFLVQPAVFLRRRVIESHLLDMGLKVAIDYEYWLRIGKEYRFYHLPRILAADRHHPQRISVARAGELRRVGEELRRRYGQKYDMSYYLTRMVDIIFSGLPRRVKGLFVLWSLRTKEDWVFSARWDGWLATAQRQLLGKR